MTMDMDMNQRSSFVVVYQNRRNYRIPPVFLEQGGDSVTSDSRKAHVFQDLEAAIDATHLRPIYAKEFMVAQIREVYPVTVQRSWRLGRFVGF